ncbi:HAD hydrolase-like protein [Thermopolyspora sp. NPDC052614]|uniref:HAD family hydrolase n=1 Tax=Thermopolyspora sp. NPDC052614 TaxID=3155682 RepID=UPI00342854C6
MGFDLDLTLADTRDGIAAVYDALSERLGVFIDGSVAASRLGPPLEVELAHWLPPEEIPEAAALYRSVYADIAVPATTAMPGAAEAVEAVRRAGGGVIVVTGKNVADARRTLGAIGLEADEVVGSVFGADKGAALADFGAAAYVGDHVADIAAARAGAALSVTVATGPYTADQLRDHGADVVLADLTGFAEWYDAWRFREIGAVSTVT